MTINYTPKDAVLDIVAVALIIAPEPVTTPIGIALLCRKRGTAAQERPAHLHQYPEYVYKVDNIRGRTITWETRTIQEGQLPLSSLNKPEIKFKEREQYIYSRTQAAKSTSEKIRENLPPGVKIHHEIYRPSNVPVINKNAFIPGETIHHTLREYPQGIPQVNKMQPASIHHTIENSPAYIKARADGVNTRTQPTIIHHTIKDSPGVQHGNPANIVKPVRIVEHHTINPDKPIMVNGRLVRIPNPQSPSSKKYTGKINELRNKDL
jgi:hypothetical protein